MAISAESHLVPLVEADPMWIPVGLLTRRLLPSAMEMLEEEFTKDALPGFGRSWPGYAAHREEEFTTDALPGFGRSWPGYADHRVAGEEFAKDALPGFRRSWPGYAAHGVAGDRRADGEASFGAISNKCARRGDDDESLCSTRAPPSPGTASRALWASEPEEIHEYELAQLDSPYEPASIKGISIGGFVMDTPVRAGSAVAPTAAEVTSAHAEAAARPAPTKQAPQIVTTLMIQNLRRCLTRSDLMFFIAEQGFAGKYDFVHLPKSLGTRRNNGFAFVNFMKLEDAEEFARSIARIKGSKMRAVPAGVQGLAANARKASSRKMTRILNSDSRPWVVGGHDQDALLHA